ncbi:MAG: hypothetical protein WCP57_08700 [Bacteroidota bacterium]
MKHTEKEIIEIGIKTMKLIGWNYNKEKKLSAGYHSIEDQLENLNRVKDSGYLTVDYDKAKNSLKAYWTICFDFEPEAEIQKNFMFLDIDDASGEPFKISHKQFSGKIIKSAEGKYSVEK